ncbi:lymphocyte cytosolic protein 2-like [Eriocheir sinensis]|uniref:lymphocyte cytosolic protein 2-like n=1 Tax=Eriocheir sinensis TaxID=95602 RepID=UPI0021C86B03|nr:lymphocyte cytosolic protein 2-like [Eriocheir sinensis]
MGVGTGASLPLSLPFLLGLLLLEGTGAFLLNPLQVVRSIFPHKRNLTEREEAGIRGGMFAVGAAFLQAGSAVYIARHLYREVAAKYSEEDEDDYDEEDDDYYDNGGEEDDEDYGSDDEEADEAANNDYRDDYENDDSDDGHEGEGRFPGEFIEDLINIRPFRRAHHPSPGTPPRPAATHHPSQTTQPHVPPPLKPVHPYSLPPPAVTHPSFPATHPHAPLTPAAAHHTHPSTHKLYLSPPPATHHPFPITHPASKQSHPKPPSRPLQSQRR